MTPPSRRQPFPNDRKQLAQHINRHIPLSVRALTSSHTHDRVQFYTYHLRKNISHVFHSPGRIRCNNNIFVQINNLI